MSKLGDRLVESNSSQGSKTSGQELSKLIEEYNYLKMMQHVHRKDTAEIEELYRKFVFPDLPVREDRYEDFNHLIGTSVGEAVYIVYFLHQSFDVSGDVCEFGVAQGATSRLLAREIMHTDRGLWLFDSFEGLPQPTEKDKLLDDIFNLGVIEKYQGTMKCRVEEVLERLKEIAFPLQRTRLVKGWIEDVVKGSDHPQKVAFAYVDFDFYEPTRLTLDYLDSRLSVGGSLVVDDYGYFSEGAKTAVDEFRNKVGTRYQFRLPLDLAGKFCILTKITS